MMLKKNIYEYSGDYLAYFLLGSLRSVGPYLMGVLHIVPLNYKDGIRGLTFFLVLPNTSSFSSKLPCSANPALFRASCSYLCLLSLVAS